MAYGLQLKALKNNSMNKAIIGLGSNINPQENIAKARAALADQFTVVAESTFIETEPVGYTDQDNFINGSVHIETGLAQEALKAKLRQMEDELGRVRSEIKFGPRSIDLDIIVFNNQIIDDDFYSRDFIKNAVLELIPDLEF